MTIGLTDDEVVALYRSRLWSVESLQQLQQAFRQDLEAGADPVFCQRRIAIIETELAARRQGGRDAKW